MLRTELLFVLSCVSTVAQIKQQPDGPPPSLTVCELLSQPLRYDGQLVQIRGRLDGTDEGAWFVGDDCPGVFVTNENHVWPSAVSLATSSSTSLGKTRLHSVDFEFNLESSRGLDPKYQRLRSRVPEKCISWTYTGLFETRRDWAEAKVVYPNGTTKVIGFGHLGTSPAQIIVKSADDVAAIPKCRGKPEKAGTIRP